MNAFTQSRAFLELAEEVGRGLTKAEILQPRSEPRVAQWLQRTKSEMAADSRAIVQGLDISVIPHRAPSHSIMSSHLQCRTITLHPQLLTQLYNDDLRQERPASVEALVMVKLLHALFRFFGPAFLALLYRSLPPPHSPLHQGFPVRAPQWIGEDGYERETAGELAEKELCGYVVRSLGGPLSAAAASGSITLVGSDSIHSSPTVYLTEQGVAT